MGTSIFQHNLSVDHDYCGCENCTDILVATRPELIQQIHESFLAVGADAVETDSFGANKLVLAEFDIAERTYELSKKSAEVARAAADKWSTKDKPRFVLGSMGPGTKLITLGNTDWDAMLDSYREQARGLIDGGTDTFLIETCQDILQVKCAINACLAALAERNKTVDDIPIQVSVTIEQTGTMLMGTTIEAAAHALRRFPIATLGLNCATGPVEMGEYIKWLGQHWDRTVTVVPNAGLPVMVEGRTEFPLKPEPFAEQILKYVEGEGVGLVGGCCGTTPAHIAALASAVGARAPGAGAHREKKTFVWSTTSLYNAVEYRQDNSFLNIGERMNASGSKKFKELLEGEKWDDIVSLARSQVREGANILDINVDYAGRDNVADMQQVVSRVVRQVDVPLMIDSTQIRTIEAGLRHAGGACVINSANFEDGEHKFDEMCRMARTFGAGLVIGTIDEDKEAAMARTADRKVAIARRAFERATTVHGIAPEDILFDPLVLPISTGMDADRRSALELIEGTRRIAAEMPRCQITCGLSNASFGLKPAARIVLNSVLLHELQQVGMTSAILNASKILPLNRIPEDHVSAALDLIYDRRHTSRGGTGLPAGITDESFDPLSRLIELFKDVTTGAAVEKKKDMTLEERLRAHIIDGEKQGLAETLEEARGKYAPLAIINDHLLDGMKTVGELFGSGQMQLPFVLQSAEVMKQSVAHLEPYLERVAGETKGTIVLATVKGDVHDIGKNLVDIILSNNGYTVHNIGIKQPLSAMVDKWKETGADAIGMSGLLVKSVNIMEENLRELNAAGITVPIILGGAALTRNYAEGYLRGVYAGPLFYGRDAFEGLRTMDLLGEGRMDQLQSEIDDRLTKRAAAEKTIAAAREPGAEEQAGSAAVAVRERVRSDVARDVRVPAAPFWGSRVVKGVDLDEVYAFINRTALFKGQWQFKKGKMEGDDYDAQVEDVILPIFEGLKQRCKAEGILRADVVYGYFPCQSDGNDLIVFDQKDHDREIERFTFPRQRDRRGLCISDFFRSTDTGEKDVLGMHCVTVGPRASEEAKKLFDANRYQDYLYLHGFGVECAEALAELWHKRMRAELGIGNDDSPKIRELFTQHYRGSRYSFGYPACPDMADQEKLFRLLDPARIGCVLTDNWQIDPEQSTSAIIVHHPEAKYFNA
jgi:5-methyltetrahydrofolate--homocysteine methyltransferase